MLKRSAQEGAAHYAEAYTTDVLVQSCFADWSTHCDGSQYYSFGDACYYCFGDVELESTEFLNMQAITINVPKSYDQALADLLWGEPARKKWQTLLDSKAIVEVDKAVARAAGADVVVLFPVYEEKVKEGVLVHKVRLVGNGKTQYKAGATYSPTPSREEFLLLLHIIAVNDWVYVHIDEVRAFLSASYKGATPVYARLAKDQRLCEKAEQSRYHHI
jgi:hypothetical protein